MTTQADVDAAATAVEAAAEAVRQADAAYQQALANLGTAQDALVGEQVPVNLDVGITDQSA